jgi:Ca2+-transporting ATPase
MEKSIHEMYKNNSKNDIRESFQKVHEYALSGTPPFMTHVFKQKSRTIIAAKGTPEGLLICTKLSEKEKNVIIEQTKKYASNGYRVLGVGKSSWPTNEWPINQTEFDFIFIGLIAFYDPPKKNIQLLIQSFYKAGINFKMITGDYPDTAISIAKQIGIENENIVLTGKEVNELSNIELQEKIKSVNVFARMFPDAKLKIIEALKRNGDIVAMTGDGVNDAPALKAAHIGISMGSRGSDVAKNASSIIITDDNLGHMIDAVAMGRKIYDNLRKAFGFIFAVHVPIAGLSILPQILGLPIILYPAHIARRLHHPEDGYV